MTEIDAMDFWMRQLSNRNWNTRRNYKTYLLKFAEWMGKTPNELIEVKKDSLSRHGDRRENMVLETALKEFMHYMEFEAVTVQGKKGYGIGSRRIAYSGVVSFFDLNQYPLSMKRGDRPSGQGIGSRIPERTEIVKLVNTAKSRRHRAAILFLKDSGLRLSDAVRLKWSETQDFGEGFWGWKIITKKRKVKALPFVGPETTRALMQLKRKKDRIFPINAKSLSNAISLLIDEAGLEELSPHGLRKYFNAELQAARIPKEWRYALMGKKFGEYDETRRARLLEAYKEAYGHLEIYGVGKIDKAEFESLKKDYELMKMKFESLSGVIELMKDSEFVKTVKRIEREYKKEKRKKT